MASRKNRFKRPVTTTSLILDTWDKLERDHDKSTEWMMSMTMDMTGCTMDQLVAALKTRAEK